MFCSRRLGPTGVKAGAHRLRPRDWHQTDWTSAMGSRFALSVYVGKATDAQYVAGEQLNIEHAGDHRFLAASA